VEMHKQIIKKVLPSESISPQIATSSQLCVVLPTNVRL
jgi:hypothetical protein